MNHPRDEYGHAEYGVTGDEKYSPDHINQGEIANAAKPIRRLEAPPLVAAMSDEERAHLERTLRRKIDFRLLPTIIIMYAFASCFVHVLWDHAH